MPDPKEIARFEPMAFDSSYDSDFEHINRLDLDSIECKGCGVTHLVLTGISMGNVMMMQLDSDLALKLSEALAVAAHKAKGDQDARPN